MLPLLRFAATREQVSTADAYEAMAAHFKLSEADLDVRLPSGPDRAFRNTVAWAKQHLTFARLFEPVRHGMFRATDLGRKWAQDRTQPLKLSDLRSIPGYDERRRGERDVPAATVPGTPEPLATSPIERIEEAHAELRQAVVANLLDRIVQKPPVFFEKLVIKLMAKLGYGDGTPESMLHTGRTGDEGIDGKIKMDNLGLDHIFLQMKRNSPGNTINREQVAAFGGSIPGAKGVFRHDLHVQQGSS